MEKNCIYEERYLKERRFFIIFLCFSLLAPVLSLIDMFRPSGEPFNTWFQRSGSAMVVLALIVEMRAYKMLEVFKPPGFVEALTFTQTKDKYIVQVKIFNVIALLLIAIGTVIWGYGDLFAKRV